FALGIEGRRGFEAMVVVAETKAGDTQPVRDAVARRVKESVGLPAADVVLVQPGTLPKTSSGKLQRSLARTRYLAEELQPAYLGFRPWRGARAAAGPRGLRSRLRGGG